MRNQDSGIQAPDPGPQVNQAIILAAGLGTRLKPFTKAIPKPLLPIKNKPVIQQVINVLAKAGMKKATAVIGYQGNKIRQYLDSQKLPIVINYAYQQQPLGSADALLSARNLINKKEPFMVTAADTIYKPEELKQMLDFFNKEKPEVLVALKSIERNQLIRRSCVHLNKDGTIKHLIEKPLPRDFPDHNFSALPIFIFKPSFWAFLDKLKPSANGFWELATAIQNCINSGAVARGFKFKWSEDITYPEDLLKCNFAYLSRFL